MTLPEIAAYLEGWRAERELQTMYCGTIAAAIYNTVPRRQKRRPLRWDDIFRTSNTRPHEADEKWEELKRTFPQKTHQT